MENPNLKWIAGWFIDVYFMENPNLRMRTGATPLLLRNLHMVGTPKFMGKYGDHKIDRTMDGNLMAVKTRESSDFSWL